MLGIGPHSSSVSVIRPHRSSTYVDAAYSYRPSSVVCPSVGLSVGLLGSVIPAKQLNRLRCRFGLLVEDSGGPRDGSPDPPMKRGNSK